MAAILADMEALGYMGEEEAKLLGLLRQCFAHAGPAALGHHSVWLRSRQVLNLAETIYFLTPPEGMVFYSRLSPQVLYHMPRDYLVHKLVGLEERVGSESSDYRGVRIIQSAGAARRDTMEVETQGDWTRDREGCSTGSVLRP